MSTGSSSSLVAFVSVSVGMVTVSLSWRERAIERSTRERALGARHAALGRVERHRFAQGACKGLESGLDHVMGVRTRLHLQVQRELGRVGQRPEELLRQLVVEAAGRAGRQLRLEQRERATGDIYRA